MRRSVVALSAAPLLLALAACGGDSTDGGATDPGSGSGSAASTAAGDRSASGRDSAAATGGSRSPTSASGSGSSDAADQDPAAIASAAKRSARSATSAHLVSHQGKGVATTDITITGRVDGSNQRVLLRRGTMNSELLTVGAQTYVKADEQTWRAQQVPASMAKTFAGKYVKGSTSEMGNNASIEQFLDRLFGSTSSSKSTRANTKVARVTHQGQDALRLTHTSGAVLIVSADERHLPLQATGGEQNPLRVDFSRWNQVKDHTAPPASQVVDLPDGVAG